MKKAFKKTVKTLLERKVAATPVADKVELPPIEAVAKAQKLLQEQDISTELASGLADVMLRSTEVVDLSPSELTKETQ